MLLTDRHTNIQTNTDKETNQRSQNITSVAKEVTI